MHTTSPKARDIARSALVSSARRRVRRLKRRAHHRERAVIRARLHELRTHPDPDDYEGDLAFRDLDGLDATIGFRHVTDKLGPLLRWAEVQLDRHPELDDATPHDRISHFRRALPDDLSGRHALDHLRWMLGEHDGFLSLLLAEHPPLPAPLTDEVNEVVAAGRHRDLNDALRRLHRARSDDDPSSLRYLAGAHDSAAFAADTAHDRAIRALVEDLARGPW